MQLHGAGAEPQGRRRAVDVLERVLVGVSQLVEAWVGAGAQHEALVVVVDVGRDEDVCGRVLGGFTRSGGAIRPGGAERTDVLCGY
jgi:hypothetical protein